MEQRTGFFSVVNEIELSKARRGDLDALEGLFRTYSQPVFTLANRLCRSREDAEEVLQETFLEMVRSIHSFRNDGAFGAWLRRISVSKILTRLRWAARNGGVTTVAMDTIPDDCFVGRPVTVDAGWQRVDIERALAQLPDASRAVVWLHDVEGLTHREIAEIFGRSVSFSKSQLSRAHGRLRTLLESTGGIGDASEPGRVVGSAGR